MAGEASSKEQTRVGIAGLGRFGKLHLSVLGRHPQVTIAALCDPAAEELDAAAAQCHSAQVYTDLGAMLGNADLDSVYLVTPEQFHNEHAKLAIARGLPTFLEKPLATTAVAGAEIAQAADAAGVFLQVGLVLRFELQHALLKQQIDAGALGEIVTLRFKRNCSRSWFDIYGDRAHSVHETIVHDIDLAVWFTGSRCAKAYAVERHVSGRTFPDACVALLQFESGAVCSLETSWLVPDRAPANVLTPSWHGTIDAELEIIGTRQSARLRLVGGGLQIWTDDLVQNPESGLWPEVHGQIAGALREEDAHFIDCVRTRRQSQITSVGDAVEGLRIAEAIIESAATGQEVTLK